MDKFLKFWYIMETNYRELIEAIKKLQSLLNLWLKKEDSKG